ncbi:UNVERIFIED_CONTAM: hypothetical protein NCL1_24951 [Trichonephila clavipes]
MLVTNAFKTKKPLLTNHRVGERSYKRAKKRTGSILVPVMAIYWLEEDQVNASNQSICDLDTLNMHQELWSGEQFRGYPTQPECKLARQSDD